MNQKGLSAANLEIMKQVWERGEVTISQVLDAVNATRETPLKRATVQVQMARLERYGWLTHRTDGRTFYYRATREQEQTNREMLMDMRDRVFGGSNRELVRCLFEDSQLSEAELERLVGLLEKTEG